MQIKLSEKEIKIALGAYLQNSGISLVNKNLSMDFTTSRGENAETTVLIDIDEATDEDIPDGSTAQGTTQVDDNTLDSSTAVDTTEEDSESLFDQNQDAQQ